MIGDLTILVTNFYHPSLAVAFNADCTLPSSNFLSFPTWYKYLPGKGDALGQCSPYIELPNGIWSIAFAVIDIMLRLAGILAVIFIIVAGFSYITSRGEPDKTASARKRIINALVGLVITMFAAVIVNFIGDRF